MAATLQDIEQWKDEAKEKGATHIISVCDSFSYEDYPVFVMPGENLDERAEEYRGKNMQRINEIIKVD